MPPKAAVEDFDDDTEFDLPTISSGAPSFQPVGGGPQQDHMAAFQNIMGRMSQGGSAAPGAGAFGSSRPPAAGPPPGAATARGEDFKQWVSVYPIYFDVKKHYGKGCRRVSYEKASPFPTQLWIAKAVGRLNLLYAQEPYKTHPQDWENPGRVKVKLFNDEGKPLNPKISNKKQLFDVIAETIQPNCGGKPPALKPRTKRIKPAATPAETKKGSKAAQASGFTSTSAPSRKQKQDLERARRDPNPNPLRERLSQIKFPPRLEDRLPSHSPALEGGILNMNLAEAMGGGPGAGGMMDQLGPLGGMLGGMGLGGDEDDDEEEEEESKAVAAKKVNEKQMPAIGRRQKKKMVRIGR